MCINANANIVPAHKALMKLICEESVAVDVCTLSARELWELVSLRHHIEGYSEVISYFGLDMPECADLKEYASSLDDVKVQELTSKNVWEDIENARSIEIVEQELNKNLSKEGRYKALTSALIALAGIYSDEACALAALPQSLKSQYEELVRPRDYTSLSTDETILLGKCCFDIIDSLSVYEDEGIYVETLFINDVARTISRQLIDRSNNEMESRREQMLRLAHNIGFATKELAETDIKNDWAIGLESLINQIKKEVIAERDYDCLSDDELTSFVKLIATTYRNKSKFDLPSAKLADILEKCSAVLWSHLSNGEGNPIRLFPAIIDIYDCCPNIIFDNKTILDYERSLVEALLSMTERDSLSSLTIMEVATSAPLCTVEGIYPDINYSNSSGISEYRKNISLWADEIIKNGHWPGIGLEEAFRRIRIFERDTIRDVKDIDYCRVIREAFNYYSKEILEIKDDGSLEMKRCSFTSLAYMSECYFNLWNTKVTDLMPVHFIQCCVGGLADDKITDAHWWTLADISLQASLMQKDLLSEDAQIYIVDTYYSQS